MYAKVSEVIKGSPLFGLALTSERNQPSTYLEGVPPQNVVIPYGVYGDPSYNPITGKLKLGLGPIDPDATQAIQAELDVIDGYVQYYFSSKQEAEEVKTMLDFAVRRAYNKGMDDGREEGVWPNIINLRVGDKLFFIEKQPGEIAHPIGLAEQYVPGAHSLHIASMVVAEQPIFRPTEDEGAMSLVDIVAEPRDSEHVYRHWTLPVDEQGNVRHFFRSGEVARQHLETLVHAQLHGIA